MARRHYFVKPVTCFLFGHVLNIFIHKLKTIDKCNFAIICRRAFYERKQAKTKNNGSELFAFR